MTRRYGRALGLPIAVAAALVLLGRPTAAVVLVVVAALVLQASRLAPARVARVERGLAHAVGAIVTVVLLAPVFLVLVVAGTGSRLLGHDPLRGPSSWTTRSIRPRRPFGDDRRRGPGPSGWRTAVAFVALGALAATFGPRLVDRDDPREDIPDLLQGGDGNQAQVAPALADAEWLEVAGPEFTEAAAGGSTYAPYVGFALQDYAGEYVNIHDRQRRSYEADPAAGDEPLDVWFFGGSTMFGFSAQRDLHTIPSEVVRLAEADGVVVRAHNYGGPGMVNFQETVLFTQLLLAGEPPDLVVFYDGINDRAVQLLNAYAGVGHVGEVGDLGAFNLRQTLAGVVTGTDEPPSPLTPLADLGPPAPPINETIDATIDVYAQGIALSEAIAGDDFPVLHFWQPEMYVKDELVPGEQELLGPLRLDERRLEALRAVAQATRERLPADVIDLGDAWDGVAEPVLTDQVHTNELGARLVAEAMYRRLVPELRRLAAAD